VKAFRQLLICFWALFLLIEPAFGLSFFKKKPYNLPDFINEEIYIDRLFQASDGIYKLKLTILIARDIDLVVVTSMYDQLKEKQISDITWVKGNFRKNYFWNKFKENKKDDPGFERILPFKKEEFVKENYEYDKDNPNLSYDRASEQKIEIYKKFQFLKSEIFSNPRQKSDHVLELHFADGSSRAIRIRQEIYRDERLKPYEKILPTMFGKGVKPDPDFAPNPVLPKEARDEANQEYQEFLERQNSVIKDRKEEAFDSAVKEIKNTYGAGEIPDFDGLYRD